MEIETKKYQYAVSVTRYDEDSEQTELVDQWITADDAIELMMHIRDNVTDASETEQEENVETHDEIEEKTVEVEPVKKTSTQKRTGIQVTYDVEAMKSDIRSGMKPQVIANKYGTSLGTVYQRKSEMKKAGELGESTSQSVVQKSGESATLPKSFGNLNIEIDEDLERDVADAIHDGETLSDLINSFPSAPLPTLKHLFEKYSHQS